MFRARRDCHSPMRHTEIGVGWCWLLALMCLGTLFSAAQTVSAVEIVDVRWGFDGKVVRHRFNLLSILVDNPKPDPFDGELRVQKTINGGQDVDAVLVEPVYVGPFARKWVQFYPYVGMDYESFRLQEVDQAGHRFPWVDLPDPRRGWPARVLVESAGSPALRGVPVKRFPDELFPPFVTATDSLQALLMDSVPNWAEPRREAFLDWLYKGGTVFVLQSGNQRFPEFPATLNVLAGPLDETTYGAGRVIRVEATRQQLSKDRLENLFSRLPRRLLVNYEGETTEISAVDDESLDDDQKTANLYTDSSDPLSSRSFLASLKSMTRPKHNWPLLHLMFWIYIGLVFPGCWLLGRKYTDYRVVYLALLATVAVFSVLFAIVGRRGYGEATAVNSTAIIQALPNDMADIASWSNVFVTSGGDYDIRHTGQGVLYSTCNISEKVPGAILNGADANFLVDMPPFSSREFAGRMRVPLSLPRIRRVKSDQAAPPVMQGAVFVSDVDFPANAESFVLLHGSNFHAVTQRGREITVGSVMGNPEGYLRLGENSNWNYGYNEWDQQEQPAIEKYRELIVPLIARELGVGSRGDAQAYALAPHVARLFYFAPLIPELQIQNRYLGKQDGYGIYVVDIPLADSDP